MVGYRQRERVCRTVRYEISTFILYNPDTCIESVSSYARISIRSVRCYRDILLNFKILNVLLRFLSNAIYNIILRSMLSRWYSAADILPMREIRRHFLFLASSQSYIE